MTTTALAIVASVLGIVEYLLNRPRKPTQSYRERRDALYRKP